MFDWKKDYELKKATTVLMQHEITPEICEEIYNQEMERIQIEEFYEPLYTRN